MSRARESHAGATQVNMVAGIVLAIASLACLFWLIPYHVQSESTPGDLPPTTVPYLAAGLVFLLSAGLIAQSWMRGSTEKMGTSGPAIFIELLIAATSIYVVLFVNNNIGFLAMAIPLTALTMIYASGRNWIVITLTAIAFPITVKFGAWHVFTVALN